MSNFPETDINSDIEQFFSLNNFNLVFWNLMPILALLIKINFDWV